METRAATVTDQRGIVVEADVIICPTCGNDTFHIYLVKGRHQHLQCVSCADSFCDGSCGSIAPDEFLT